MPIRLKLAFNQNYAVSGMTFDWTTLFAKVRNEAFDKQVDLVYSPLGSSAWFEHPLGFVSHHGNYDVFGSDSVTLSGVETFALRYRVAGSEYWDNNFGADYTIGPAFSGKVGGHVSLRSATAFRSRRRFHLRHRMVRGRDRRRQPRVQQTGRRAGMTWNTVNGSYLGPVAAIAANVAGVEVWKFKAPQLNIEPTSDVYRFAVFFEVTDWGLTYWDNNFGQDYFLSQTAGSTLA